MRTALLLILTCLLQAQVVFGQKNYVPGYLVTSAGDTIRGEIDFRNWRINPTQIDFRKAESSEAVTYTPKDIRLFQAGEDLYFSGLIEAEKSTRNISDMDNNPEFSIMLDTAFLRVLISGEKSLYHYIDQEERENFYIGTDRGFELLRYKEYLVKKDGQNQKQIRRLFIGQLSNYLSDCPGVQRKLSQLEYNRKSLLRAFETYYECLLENETYVEKDRKVNYSIVAVAGISRTSFGGAHLSPSTDPTLGISLDAVFPWNASRWTWSNTFLLTHYSTEGANSETTRLGRYTRYEYEKEAVSLKLHSMLRYSSGGNSLRYFLGGGLLCGYRHSIRGSTRKYTEFGPDSETQTWEDPVGSMFPFGYVLGAGASLQKLSLQLHYENIISSNSVYLLLGYRIGK